MTRREGFVDDEGLFERGDAIKALTLLFERLYEGEGHSLFLVGEAGLGKTTLLRRIESAARVPSSRFGQCLIGRADGLPFGSTHSFGLADRLFATLALDRPAMPDPGDQQKRSNRFISAVRALDECTSRSPVVLMFDDLHWSDGDSLALLEFLGRHIPSRSVSVIATLRSWPADAMEVARRLVLDGYASICQLSPLSHEASIALMVERVWGDTPRHVVEKASLPCAGNPLLLEEVARSLIGRNPVPALEPFSPSRRAVLLRRFAAVSDETFRFLRAASALGVEFQPSIAAVVAGFDALEADTALEEACAAGIVQAGSSVATFVHPTFAEAVYEGIHAPLRAEVHAAAFRAIRSSGGPAQQAAEHAIMAGAIGEAAVSVMREAGLEALGSGAWPAAVRFLSNAIETAGPRATATMIREHAEALVGSGDPAEAVKRLEELVALGDLECLELARVMLILGQARLAAGLSGSPLECFEEAARIFEPIDRQMSVDALLQGAFIASALLGGRPTIELADRARALSSESSKSVKLQIDVAWGSGALMLGMRQGPAVLERVVAAIEEDPSLLDEFSQSGWWPLAWCSSAAAATERFDAAQQVFELGYAAAKSRGWPAAMGAHLVVHFELMFRLGHLDRAEASLDKIEELVEHAPILSPFAILLRTDMNLQQGRITEAERELERVEARLERFETPPPNMELWALFERGRLEVSREQLPRACAAFEKAEQVAIASEISEPCIVPWWLPAIDAYRAVGKFEALERVVGWLDRVVTDLPCRWPRATALAGHAMLEEAAGRIGAARFNFDQAVVEMEDLPMPFERAELLTWLGGFQRRQGDLRSARKTLLTAFDLADSRGAGVVARAAHLELRRAGGRVRRERRPVGGLTARQSEVAHLASVGRTNIEIAVELGIKKKTVEHHLEAVYNQLGVRSRRDLMRGHFDADYQSNDKRPSPPR